MEFLFPYFWRAFKMDEPEFFPI